jgi:hypothetical protein
MRTFLVFNEISAEIIKELSNIKLEGAVSIHTPAELENILSQFKDGDTLIIECINLFNGVYELYSALSFISSLSNGHFISLQQSLLKIDKGHINEELLEMIAMGARLEEKCSNMAKTSADIESIKDLKRLCIRVLEDAFSKSKNI